MILINLRTGKQWHQPGKPELDRFLDKGLGDHGVERAAFELLEREEMELAVANAELARWFREAFCNR